MGLARMSVTMTDLDRLKCIQGFVDGIERSERVAERLGITSRQIRRLAKRYRDQGPVGLLSLRRNQRSNNRLSSSIEGRVASILRDSYADFGPTLAAEKLEELHQIRLSKDTIRQDAFAHNPRLSHELRGYQGQGVGCDRRCNRIVGGRISCAALKWPSL